MTTVKIIVNIIIIYRLDRSTYVRNILNDTGELMIIVEYCSFGNIKKYLETNRDHFIDQIDRDTDKIDSTIEAAQNHPK